MNYRDIIPNTYDTHRNYLDEYLKTLNIEYVLNTNGDVIIIIRNSDNAITLTYYTHHKEITIPLQSELHKFKDNEFENFMVKSAIINIFNWDIDEIYYHSDCAGNVF